MAETENRSIVALYGELCELEFDLVVREAAARESLAPLGGVGLDQWRDSASGADGLRIAALEHTIEREVLAGVIARLQATLGKFERRSFLDSGTRRSSRP